MGRIPQNFIDELLARTDIVETIDARVQLKKKGREYAACCPFHAEKTPSFYVSPQKQFYHCFGCGAHGTVINFLMEFEHLEFPEAVRMLAEQAGLEVPEEAGGRQDTGTGRLYALMAEATEFYRRELKRADRAIEYLKTRGVSGEIAAEYGLGYAPADWDSLLKALGGDPQRRQDLVACGMGIRKDSGSVYDRFRDRVMFPIRDVRGRTIAFGGRILDQGEPKYLNSPETPLFHKGRELYGLYEARQALREIPRLVVVEGYMDVLALAQHGIRYAVATLGTATTVDHLNRLFRICPEVVFCFDGDRAGLQAAWRALENALPAVHDGRQIGFLFLPEGEDPDSLVRREGAEGFSRRLAQATPLSDYLCDHLAAQTDMRSVDGRARLVDLARPLIRRIPDPVYRSLLEEKLAGMTRLSADKLSMLMGGEKTAGSRARKAPGRLAMTPVRRAIVLLLNRPALAGEVAEPQKLGEIDMPGMAAFADLVEFFQAHPGASAAAALENWREDPLGEHLARLARQPLESPEDHWQAEFTGLLDGFRRHARNTRLDELRARDFRSLSDAEKAELQTLLSARQARPSV